MQPWGFFLLLGGFVYFGADGALLAINAITPSNTRHYLPFDGPFSLSTDGLQALHAAHRMV